jgi:hypothetical protein
MCRKNAYQEGEAQATEKLTQMGHQLGAMVSCETF